LKYRKKISLFEKTFVNHSTFLLFYAVDLPVHVLLSGEIVYVIQAAAPSIPVDAAAAAATQAAILLTRQRTQQQGHVAAASRGCCAAVFNQWQRSGTAVLPPVMSS
jgi:hypothetical protein